jgi:hypothetical protein
MATFVSRFFVSHRNGSAHTVINRGPGEIFNFREQTLKMEADDAPGQGLQSAIKKKNQTNFSIKLWVFQF